MGDVSDNVGELDIDPKSPPPQTGQSQAFHAATTIVKCAGGAPMKPLPHQLPIPSRPPTCQDWQAYRVVFTLLYRTEGRSLRKTKAILQERYGFQATYVFGFENL